MANLGLEPNLSKAIGLALVKVSCYNALSGFGIRTWFGGSVTTTYHANYRWTTREGSHELLWRP